MEALLGGGGEFGGGGPAIQAQYSTTMHPTFKGDPVYTHGYQGLNKAHLGAYNILVWGTGIVSERRKEQRIYPDTASQLTPHNCCPRVTLPDRNITHFKA